MNFDGAYGLLKKLVSDICREHVYLAESGRTDPDDRDIFAGAGYEVETNHEHGTGRPDIVVADEVNRRALIIEAKHSKSREAMEADCRGALKQIDFR